MTSYEFEVICKNALINTIKIWYNEDLTIEDLHLVWYAKELKNHKCVIVDLKENQRYYELTYNGEKDEIYLDIYEKKHNVVVNASEFDTIAKPSSFKIVND